MIHNSLLSELSFLSSSAIESKENQKNITLINQQLRDQEGFQHLKPKICLEEVQNNYRKRQFNSSCFSPHPSQNPLQTSMVNGVSKNGNSHKKTNYRNRYLPQQEMRENKLLHKNSNIFQSSSIHHFPEHVHQSHKCQVFSAEQSISIAGTRIGGKQFISKLEITNFKGSQKFFNSTNKLITNENEQLIVNFLKSMEGCLLFQPNFVLIPEKCLKIIISLEPIIRNPKNEGSIYHTLFVDLSRKGSGKYLISKITGKMKFQLTIEIITESKKKKNILNKMNYKLTSAEPHSSMILLKKMRVTFMEDAHEQNQSKTFQVFLPQKKKKEDPKGLISYLKTCVGSKQYQQLIKAMTQEQIDDFIEDIYDYIPQLVKNQFGNYLIQGLIYECTPPQHTVLFNILIPHFATLPRSKQGTFTLQRLIEFLTEYQLKKLFLCIKDNFLELALHYDATYFVRKLIQFCEEDIVVEGFAILDEFFISLAQHRNGVCIMREMIRRIGNSPEQELRKIFVKRIEENIEDIINNEYGNYLIQQIYENFTSTETLKLDKYIVENFHRLSTLQYSSLVVVKCLRNFWKSNSRIKKLLKKTISDKAFIALKKSKHGKKIAFELKDYNDTDIEEKIINPQGKDNQELRVTRSNTEGDEQEDEEEVILHTQHYNNS